MILVLSSAVDRIRVAVTTTVYVTTDFVRAFLEPLLVTGAILFLQQIVEVVSQIAGELS
jgi:hypothetical protein